MTSIWALTLESANSVLVGAELTLTPVPRVPYRMRIPLSLHCHHCAIQHRIFVFTGFFFWSVLKEC